MQPVDLVQHVSYLLVQYSVFNVFISHLVRMEHRGELHQDALDFHVVVHIFIAHRHMLFLIGDVGLLDVIQELFDTLVSGLLTRINFVFDSF